MESFDLVVMGAGVAGLMAAATAAQRGLSVMVLDPQGAGGQVANVDHIANLPGLAPMAGWELGPLLQEQADAAGAGFMLTAALALRRDGTGCLVDTAEGTLQARAVIVASGSSRRRLGVPGEQRLQGFGVSHCASCDGPLMRGLRVCVVGGGDAAATEALALAAHASEVMVLHRGPAMRAQPALRARLLAAANIRVMPHTEVEEIVGERNVSALRLRESPAGASRLLEAEGVFVNIGLEPHTAFLAGLLALDDAGRIVTDAQLRSSVPGIFAAGDVRSGSAAMLAASAGDGVTAAAMVQRYLAG
ncbi:MAG TPA: FAD-dependent oxidoreductase [Ideonella sp.]|nr:FAD-dependent oxidoreductase [Ideonella sp.]